MGALSISSTEESLLENGCELSENDIWMLQSVPDNRADEVTSSNEITDPNAWCPYTSDIIDLGPEYYPLRWTNVTCLDPSTSGLCGASGPLGADVTSSCVPVYYNVVVFRLITTSSVLTTSNCVIDTYRKEMIPIVTGCSCRELDQWRFQQRSQR